MVEEALLYREVAVPGAFLSTGPEGRAYGGDVRIGDLDGDGRVDFLVYKALGGIKPSFLGAFSETGDALWSAGDREFSVEDEDGGGRLQTTSPGRPGPVALYDIDGDGATEVICLLADFQAARTSRWHMGEVRLAVLEGSTGRIRRQAAPDVLRSCTAWAEGEIHPSNYLHQRMMIANLRGAPEPRDLVLKLGDWVLAFSQDLDLLWTYRKDRWFRYPGHSAYIPAVGDLDGDGRDEVHGGHFGLDHDGTVLWERDLGENMDTVLVEEWDGDPGNGKEAIVSGEGLVLDGRGNTILHLGPEKVPHGQEVRWGEVRPDSPGPELVIRYNGHRPDLMVVSNRGEVQCRFQADESPNNTGLEIVHWAGKDQAGTIYSPAALFDGHGRRVAAFPGLPPPVGGRMGWYHCFAADVCGDDREEVVLYNPDADRVYIYTSPPYTPSAFAGYRHGPRQYNARLID